MARYKTNQMNPYDYFARFYRELITTTGRLQAEQHLLDELICRLKVDREASILDAACGTGDALFHLLNRGYRNLAGLDGSKGMLGKARQLLSDLPICYCRWTDLEMVSTHMHNTYDLIFLLSNSLAHGEVNEFPLIFKSFHRMLKPGGYLIFDVRKWTRLSTGILVEPNRPVHVPRLLAKIELDDAQCLIEDECWYTEHRQIVRYTCRPMCSDPYNHFGELLTIDVSYALVTADEFVSNLHSAGFKETAALKYEDWSYLVICSRAKFCHLQE